MRRIHLLVIGVISFFAVAAGSIWQRAIALSLCGLLGINSPACYWLGNRVNAAVPPENSDSTLMAQNIDIFSPDGGGSSSPAPTDIFAPPNPQNPPQPGGEDIFAPPDSTSPQIYQPDTNPPKQPLLLTIERGRHYQINGVNSNKDKEYIADLIITGGQTVLNSITVKANTNNNLPAVTYNIEFDRIGLGMRVVNNKSQILELRKISENRWISKFTNPDGSSNTWEFPAIGQNPVRSNTVYFAQKIFQPKSNVNYVEYIIAQTSCSPTAQILNSILDGIDEAVDTIFKLFNFFTEKVAGNLPEDFGGLNETEVKYVQDLSDETEKSVNGITDDLRNKLNLEECDNQQENIARNPAPQPPTTTTTPQPTSSGQSQPIGQLTKGTSYGDPHLITFDGYRYSFQTVGEFILAKSTSGDFEVQTRQAAVPGRPLSLNTAAAMRVGNNRVAFYSKFFPDSDPSNPLRVNGKPTVIEDGSLSLPGGGTIYKQGDLYYTVEWPTGEQVAIKMIQMAGSQYMNVTPAVFSSPPGRFIGLLGNLDREPSNDLRTRSGNVLPSQSTYGKIRDTVTRIVPIPGVIPLGRVSNLVFDQLYKNFGNSWRISQEESLFDYAPSQTTATFTDRSFPKSYKTLDMLSPQQIQQAETACIEAGVEPDLLEGCIFDVGFTGDASFAQAAANALNILEQLDRVIPGGVPVPKPRLPVNIPSLPF